MMGFWLCLNPYCFGLWSLRTGLGCKAEVVTGLNPYCFGLWSLSVVQDALTKSFLLCLNPYCFGLWSLRVKKLEELERGFLVLILIVLDYGH